MGTSPNDLITMNSASLSIKYDGLAVRAGTMSVRQLAPALLAIDSMFETANTHVNGDKAKLEIKINAGFEPASFTFELVTEQNLVSHVIDMFRSSDIQDTETICKILFGGSGLGGAAVGVFNLFKWLHGRKDVRREEKPGGTTYIDNSTNNNITVNPNVDDISRIPRIRRAFRDIDRPLDEDDMDLLEVKFPDGSTVRVNRQEGESVRPPENEEESLARVETTETWLDIVAPVLTGNYQWRFKYGPLVISARMQDEAFVRRVSDGEIFQEGDSLRVMLEITIQLGDGAEGRRSYLITQVLDHRHRPPQSTLPGIEG